MRPSASAEELQLARELIRKYGWNSTSCQILNPGIDLWFSDAGDAVVGYVTRHSVKIVAGAPVCASDRLRDVAREFEAHAAKSGHRVCYFGAEARLEAIYDQDTAYSMVLLGAQPVWRPDSWAAIVAGRASLRAQLNRARNKQVIVSEWPESSLQTGQARNPELQRCLREWLSSHGLPPLHFLVEPETLGTLADRRIFVAERNEKLIGFLLASPVPQRNGWLIEQIVRGGARNGTAELLIDAAMRALALTGAKYATLGLAPLSKRAKIAVRPNPWWIKAIFAWVRAHGKRFYNFDGLDAFKAKFRPDSWEPVYAIANERRFSFMTLYAIGAAFSEGSPILTVLRAAMQALKTEIIWFIQPSKRRVQ